MPYSTLARRALASLVLAISAAASLAAQDATHAAARDTSPAATHDSTSARPAPPVGADTSRAANLDLSAPIPNDPKVVVGTLPNGIRYYIRENHRPEKRAELRLVVNAGSVLEDSTQRGLAHVVEHMAFNGTTHFARQALVDYLESTGVRFGADLNASTSFDETIYKLTVPTDSAALLDKGFQILEDWAHGVTFDSTLMEKERKVVEEEWRLGLGAGERMRDKQFPILFKGSRYAERLPIGTKQSLDTFKRADVVRFYRDWYRPDLQAVVAVGDFDAKRIEQLIRQHFTSIPARTNEKPRTIFDVPGHDSTYVTIATDPEATQSTVAVYWLQSPTPDSTLRDYRQQLVEALYNSMLNDRFREIAQRPGAPFVGAYSVQGRLIRSSDVYILSAVVKDSGITRGLDAIVTEAERVAQHGFTPSELDRAKRETLRFVEQAYAERDKSSSASFVGDYVNAYLEHEPFPGIENDYRLSKSLVPGIQLDEVNRLAREWLGGKNRVVLVNAPQKTGVPVPADTTVLATLASAERQPVTAYVDSVSNAPLVPNPPKSGRIVSARAIPTVGVTEWKLSNGVRVLIKPTDFKDDEIVMRAYRPGGTSVVDDAHYPSAAVAGSVIDASGLGTMSQSVLEKRLADKSVGVDPEISAYREGVSGEASPKDQETLFQLTYLYFTAPRWDSAAYVALKSRVQALLANRALSPEAAFEDTLEVTLTQHHPRAEPITSAFLDKVDPHAALDFYRARFGDASGFTFIFVGNIDTVAFKPLVERWLGGLPASHAVASWKDRGLRYPTSVIRREVKRGVAPKSETAIVFTGPFDFGWRERYVITALTDLLEIKLRERLREQLGGTYGVSVSASPTRIPVPTYELRIAFGSDPARAAELERAVFAEIDSLKRVGPSSADVQKVRETELRERETSLRRNAVWAGLLESYESNGWEPSLILTYTDLVKQLDAKLLQDAARKYFDDSRYVEVRLVPEASAGGS